MTQHLSTLMEKEVSRKEFLGMAGLAAASILGFGSAIKLLTGKSIHVNQSYNHGYGSSAYGGK
jgi:hypothetical protein